MIQFKLKYENLNSGIRHVLDKINMVSLIILFILNKDQFIVTKYAGLKKKFINKHFLLINKKIVKLI